MKRAALVFVIVACNGNASPPPPPPPSPTTAIVRDSAVAIVHDATPAALLAFDELGSDGDPVDRTAYGDRAPRLPAVGSNGAVIAYVEFDEIGPEATTRHIEIADLATGAEIASLPLASRANGDAVVERLRADGFASLESVALAPDGHNETAKLGPFTLKATYDDGGNATLVLVDAAGALAQQASFPAVEQGGYRIRTGLESVYVDRRHIYLYMGSHGNEEATLPPNWWIVWDLPALATPDGAAIAKAIASDARTTDALVIGTPHAGPSPSVSLSRDGASAIATSARTSELLASTPAGWKIAAAFASDARPNADVDRDAKAGKAPPPLALPPAGGDASLLAAFAALAADGVDATAAKRADLVAIGSGPGERTVGGAVLARGWNAAWKGKLTIASSTAGLAPSGTTGWVVARVTQAKSGYAVPFTLFCIFDKTATGAWSLVHVHFAA
ncbi:MAG TPA: hypothetical protein VGG28_17160 [Kofleriaceae bacterium]|jgi:hypothetical protein